MNAVRKTFLWNMSRLVGMGLMVLMTGILGSCTKPASSTAALRLWIMPNSPKSQQDLEEVLAPFLEKNPDITVTVTVLDWASGWQKLTTGAIAGDIADVVQIGSSWCGSLTGMGALRPIDSLAAALNLTQAFHGATLTNARPIASTKTTSLPWFIDIRPIYYRTDVFEKAGITAASIATWDDFHAALQKVRTAAITHEGSVVAPLGFPGKNDWNVVHNFSSWIWSAGGDILNEQGDSCVVNSEAAIAGVLYYLQFVREGLAPKMYLEKNSAQVSAEFDAGRIATLIEPTIKYIYLNLPAEQGGLSSTPVARNYGLMIPPTGPGGKHLFMGGSHLAVSKASRFPTQAMRLIAYLCADSTAQIDYAKRSGWLPALTKAIESPYFTADEKRSAMVKTVAFGRTFSSAPYWAEIETAVLVRHFGNIFDIAAEVSRPYSEQAVRSELDATAAEINAIIREHFKNNPADAATIRARISTLSTGAPRS